MSDFSWDVARLASFFFPFISACGLACRREEGKGAKRQPVSVRTGSGVAVPVAPDPSSPRSRCVWPSASSINSGVCSIALGCASSPTHLFFLAQGVTARRKYLPVRTHGLHTVLRAVLIFIERPPARCAWSSAGLRGAELLRINASQSDRLGAVLLWRPGRLSTWYSAVYFEERAGSGHSGLLFLFERIFGIGTSPRNKFVALYARTAPRAFVWYIFIGRPPARWAWLSAAARRGIELLRINASLSARLGAALQRHRARC